MLNTSKSPKNSPFKFNSSSFTKGKINKVKDLINFDLEGSNQNDSEIYNYYEHDLNENSLDLNSIKIDEDLFSNEHIDSFQATTKSQKTNNTSPKKKYFNSPTHHINVSLESILRPNELETNSKDQTYLNKSQKIGDLYGLNSHKVLQNSGNANRLHLGQSKSHKKLNQLSQSEMDQRNELIQDLKDKLDIANHSTNSGQNSNLSEEIIYPTLKQPILLDDVEYFTKIKYSSNEWQLCVKSSHFENIEYQVYVTPAHHSRITSNNPIHPRGLFELVKGALFDGVASFDYFWIRGTEYMTLGNVNAVSASQNGWKGDPRQESDRLLLWVGLGKDLGYWLILEPVLLSSKHLLKKIKSFEIELNASVMQNKSLLIRNEMLLRHQELQKEEIEKQREDIIDLKKENAKLKQMLVNMIQHMVQKQQKMMEALGDLEAINEIKESTPVKFNSNNKKESGFVWNPLKKHEDLSLSNFCKIVISKDSPSGKWASILGDNIWKNGIHKWDIILRGESDPQYQSVIIGVADPDHPLDTFCGSTPTSYGLFIHSGNVYHNEKPKSYIRTIKEYQENDQEETIPFIEIKPLDCITVILDLESGTLKYDINHSNNLGIAFENVKGPLCACISFCDSTLVELI